MGWLLAAAVAALGATAWLARRGTAVLRQRLAAAAHDLETLQHAFGRFAPAAVVEDIIAQGVSTHSGTKEVTVLFADLKGFTRLAETVPPERLVAMLNGYFDAMSRVLAAHRGHLAKFIGDGLMALFGALEPNPWQTNDAVAAALGMRAALAKYNARLERDGLPPLALGIGIHRGPVVAGVLGTSELMEYGVIGATVNVAARVEGLTRVHGTDVLVTDAVRQALDPRFRLRPMPPVEVKGITEAVATWEVEGMAE